MLHHQPFRTQVTLCTQTATLLLRCSADSNARAAHAAEAHPYKPFPVNELEAAVAQVPLSNFEEAERVLTQFGSPYFIRSAVHNLLMWLLPAGLAP